MFANTISLTCLLPWIRTHNVEYHSIMDLVTYSTASELMLGKISLCTHIAVWSFGTVEGEQDADRSILIGIYFLDQIA